MTTPIVVVYHCVFLLGDPPELSMGAVDVVREQMQQFTQSGLFGAASRLLIGVNGPEEESLNAARLLLPAQAELVMHGADSFAENKTILMIERLVKEHLGEAYICYQHCKGASHGPGPVRDMRTLWRRCATKHLVWNWKRCVADLDAGYESVGVHWMEPPATPTAQFIWAGNLWWSKASFLRTLPPLMERARIKESGIGSLESRYEAEVWQGNGSRPPTHRDYHGPGWNPSQVHTCANS